jgi:phospho-N-acetylmuramoyl-pentapeptide-transferase
MDFLRVVVIPDITQTLLLAFGAFLLTLFGGHHWIRWLVRHKVGKQVRLDGPESHLTKTGTPTMGGAMIVTSVVCMTVCFNLVGRWSMLLPLAVLIAYAIVGGWDDFMSLTGTRSKTYGLSARYKFLWLWLLALIASCALYLPAPYGLANEGLVQIPFVGARNIGYWYIPLATLIIVATSNAVNFADGVDGLSSWLLVLAFTAYGVISFVAYPRLTYLSPFAFTLTGACVGFLWFNAHPAQVIMGDTGALALGAVLAVVALISQHWVLLPVIGVMFVAETLSVVLQVSYFKWTRRRYGAGRRLFRMAPIHHHFELRGWSETQVMQRFVLIGMIAALIGVSLALTTPESRGLPPAPPPRVDSR